ncbi:D-alanyl-D-alanine carboxypeptidase [Lentilactobacillus kosonis]|nr:D-alanyl-D-alanine carboxypeptidase [Lentilactobacillus kosonis]
MALVFLGSKSASASKLPSNYSFDVMKAQDGSIPYMVKPTVKSGYIWNYSHTKRIHNIKNYPSSNWYVNYASIKKYGNKSSVYYRVVSNSGKVKGLIWSGYLTRILALEPDSFNSEASFDNYMQTNRSQRLSREIMKLFPNSKLSLDLTKATQGVNPNHPFKTNKYTDVINIGDLQPTGSTDELNNIGWKLSQTSGDPITPRINYVKQVLEDNGYTAQKRNSMSDYYLGLYITDNAQIGTEKDFPFPYPTIQSDDGMTLSAQLFLAKLK